MGQIFKLAAGIGLFLFAMYLLEESLKNLSGRNFKLFLQRVTRNRVGAAAGGAIITAILQSSSMVSLMVLAFVGAGVFTMENAMAIILGANLGTTLDSWMVATLGFNMDIEWIAYPAICIGGALMIIFGNRKSAKYASYFLFGFGLLFIGLSFMKSAMESQVQQFDFAQYADMPLAVFLLLGFLITLLVQSSSVTMALTLSAIHAGAIGFAPAAAIVLGSETGTIIKILLGSIRGSSTKKRVAFGNLFFNVALTIAAFALLRPILYLIQEGFGIHDPLIGLVTFSTLVNLLGLVIFLPLLKPFTRLLLRFFNRSEAGISAFIDQANVAEPETALDLFRKETEYFLYNVMSFNLLQFEIDLAGIEDGSEFKSLQENRKFLETGQPQKYELLKQHQGELQAFYLALRSKTLKEADAAALQQMIGAVRSAMLAAKCLNDIGKNISNLSSSPHDIQFGVFAAMQQDTAVLYLQLTKELRQPNATTFETLQGIYKHIDLAYNTALNEFYQKAANAKLESADLTMVINFNRELFTSNKAILMAVKELVLKEQQSAEFNEVPVYRT